MAQALNNMLIGKKRQNITFLNKKKENNDDKPAKKKRKFTRKDMDPTDKYCICVIIQINQYV